MPCFYEETPEERAASEQERKTKLKNELDKVTRLLCWVMGEIKYYDGPTLLPKNEELENWYKEHEKRDEQRRKEVKEAAKKKLTKEELQALGIE